MSINSSNQPVPGSFLLDALEARQYAALKWLHSQEDATRLPLYSSVDIRDAGFKAAVVDTNLFPAGFNNLCDHGLKDAALFFRFAIQRRVPDAKNILIITEEHTRNTWYLENVRVLQSIIEEAGFRADIATFLTIQPAFCETIKFAEFETATAQHVRIHCLKNILYEIENDQRQVDLVILNNDLTKGIPDILKHSSIPVYPSAYAGWHSRLKSEHFYHLNILTEQFAGIIGVDPWFFSTRYRTIDNVNLNEEKDRRYIRDVTHDLFAEVERKYHEHSIDEKPYFIMKPDYGTYGMGVLAIEEPDDILKLNSKQRSKLYSGKGSRVNDRWMIQEGIPTICTVDGKAGEVCMYQIENHLIGGFYRFNVEKGSRDNLNTKGMNFKKMCPHDDECKECDYPGRGAEHSFRVFDFYRILARIAAVAAQREIIRLEECKA
ncbi:MAG: glutamate--cysteine ligase [Candidatus Omnitrophota bacterium]